ncbi:ferritin-like domain-containing protein [Halovivax gelatinilyticus]|uniref:YciE/YciF ferroxidase family protein n=1 Tax=Halovivax gelatinilyticus TaxID=2961597 RepID=UPI0020CA808E|nr:DUF892 family protein [Halovivax gelatinilyticus]
MHSLEDMFEQKLRQQYYAETQLVEELDHMARRASNDRLSDGLAEHRDETREHVSRLESVFDEIGSTPAPTEDAVVDGMKRERESMDDAIDDDGMRDMAYMIGGMTTERVEMTGYEGLLMMANRLEYDDAITDPLEANHDEEESAYRELEAMSTASDMKAFWERITPS